MSRLPPIGTQLLYLARRDAGIPAVQQRNIPWIDRASDGTTVMNVWRKDIRTRGTEVVAVVKARKPPGKKAGPNSKRKAVVEGLSREHGRFVKVIVLEALASGLTKAARYDNALWLVEDTGREFLLWRGRQAKNLDKMPATPAGYGHVAPRRRETVSSHIERDPRVKTLTLKRANYQCEISGCKDAADYESLDVHHIESLGMKGSDHTDNTVALCPSCHTRIHRGVPAIRRKLERRVELIRRGRKRRRTS